MIAGFIIVFYLSFYLTVLSIKKLKVSIFSAYPFDLFFPGEKKWSAGFFIVIILILGALVFLLFKGGFYSGTGYPLGGPA